VGFSDLTRNSGPRRRGGGRGTDRQPPDDAIDTRPVSKQVFDTLGDAVDAVHPSKHARVLQGKDRLVDRIAAAAGFFSDGLVGGKAKAIPVAREMPQERV
jgi:hypothetical protein